MFDDFDIQIQSDELTERELYEAFLWLEDEEIQANMAPSSNGQETGLSSR